jgi:hypothetical protein
MHINVRYSFKIEDFVEILEVADKLSPRQRRIRFGAKFVAGLLLAAPFLASSGPSHPDQFLLGLSSTSIFLFGWGLITPKRVATKYYNKEVDGTEYEATITEKGITTTSPSSRAEFQWSAFSKAIEGANQVALIDKTIMYVFPKRAFNQEQWTEFINLLHTHIPVWDADTRTVRLF